jgi:hypothetical protein
MAAALIPLLTSVLPNILDKVIPDKNAAARAQAEILDKVTDLTAKADTAQAEINKIEAGHANLFVSGWRPAVGWLCVAAMAYTYILVPVGMYVGFLIGKPIPKPPVLDGNLWELTFAMLGLSGIRTFEKVKGVAR